MKSLMSVLVLVLFSTGGCTKLPEEQQIAPDHDDRYNNVIVQDDDQDNADNDSKHLKIPIM